MYVSQPSGDKTIFACMFYTFHQDMDRYFIFIFVALVLACPGCSGPRQQSGHDQQVLHIIHAGSLSVPMREIANAFTEENPGVRILTEAWGSKAGARRVIDLDTPADVFLSADYMVIENMLIPDHASWHLPFAANEMAIVYTAASRHAGQITQDNWFDILLRPRVSSGRSDPDHDPCGVRTVFTCKLAEIFYNKEGLAKQLLDKAADNLRPKETDLIALLESGHLDYIYLYRSVALQHGLPYLQLPPELSLGDPELNHRYAQVSTRTLGSVPGEQILEYGQAMVYGLTIPHKSTNKTLAEAFVAFVMEEDHGQHIFQSLGQPPLAPSPTAYYDFLPERLKVYGKPKPKR